MDLFDILDLSIWDIWFNLYELHIWTNAFISLNDLDELDKLIFFRNRLNKKLKVYGFVDKYGKIDMEGLSKLSNSSIFTSAHRYYFANSMNNYTVKCSKCGFLHEPLEEDESCPMVK